MRSCGYKTPLTIVTVIRSLKAANTDAFLARGHQRPMEASAAMTTRSTRATFKRGQLHPPESRPNVARLHGLLKKFGI